MSTTEDLYQDTIRLWAPLQELYRRRNELWESAYEQRLARFGGDRLLEAHSGTVQDEFTPAEAEMYRSLTARARLASSAYNQAVDAYNAQRNAEEEARARQARAQKHNATVTRIRQAACPVCLLDAHGGVLIMDAEISRKAKRGESVVLVDGTEWEVHRANVNGDVWLAIDGEGLHGPYDTTEYRVVVTQEDNQA